MSQGPFDLNGLFIMWVIKGFLQILPDIWTSLDGTFAGQVSIFMVSVFSPAVMLKTAIIYNKQLSVVNRCVLCKGAFTPTQENTRGTWFPPAGSAVDWFVEIVWCCLHRRRSTVPPQRGPQRSLTERLFCGNCRNRERWLVRIYSWPRTWP